MTENTKLIEKAIQKLKNEFRDSSFVTPTVNINNYFCGYNEHHKQVLLGFVCIVKTGNKKEYHVTKFIR